MAPSESSGDRPRSADAGGLHARLAALAHGPRSRALLTLATADAAAGAVGAHRSRARGAGTEFADHKVYAPGDDLRRLDWRMLARSDRLVVRQHETQRALRAEIIVDVSRSMDYGTTPGGGDRPGTKAEAAAFAATLLGARLLAQGDGVRLTLAGNEARTLAPRRGEAQLEAWCKDVAQALPAAARRTALEAAVAAAVARLRTPGLIAVCADGLDEDRGWLGRLVEARSAGHGVVFLHTVDPAEEDLPFTEPAGFVDPEGGPPLPAHPGRIRRRYRELFAAHLASIRGPLLDAGARHLVLRVGVAVGPVLDGELDRRPEGHRWS